MNNEVTHSKRCAIYTRKSVMEAEQKEVFNSLQSQRECCASYIASQRGESWELLDTQYDDGGFSGGDMKRPALQHLLADIAAGRIDIVVVYKIDRLTRSLADFGRLVACFEKNAVTFVSVTQSFNTTTSMGKLLLNILLSFAQFERELTSERLSDFFANARQRGLWLNCRPYGYVVVDRRLQIHSEEAAGVRRAFALYPKLGSCRLVAEQLTREGVLNKTGKPFCSKLISHMLQHRVYRGEIVHKKQGLAEMAHEPIVSETAWRKAQVVIATWRERRRPLRNCAIDPMLKGLLQDGTGHRMHHTYMHAKGRLYRYYVSGHEKLRYGARSDATTRFRAPELEAAVAGVVNQLAGVPAALARSDAEIAGLVRRLV